LRDVAAACAAAPVFDCERPPVADAHSRRERPMPPVRSARVA
jgi:hypothetical protein